MTIEIHADASWDPRTGETGCAFWIKSYQVEVRKALYLSKIHKSEQAEAKAVNLAVSYLLGMDLVPITAIHIYSDSIPGMRELNSLKKYGVYCLLELIIKNGMPTKRYLDIVKFKHIKGHTKSNDTSSNINRWCHAEANAARKTKRNHVEVLKDISDILL